MVSLAKILHRSSDEIRFRVDEVEPRYDMLSVIDARTHFEARCGGTLLTFEHTGNEAIVANAYGHPLVAAVDLAFNEHRPLILTPDVIWMTIAQGFAQHVNIHAEELQSLFVRHEGKAALAATLSRWEMADDWAGAVAELERLISQEVGPETHDLLINDFSTTTPTIRTASQIVMMDAFQRYFDYMMRGVCGIPTITLTGTVEDWTRILQRVRKLERYQLGWWAARLIPICENLVDGARGEPDLSFWQQIYKPAHMYGGDVVTGWLADLFPYLAHAFTGTADIQNPILLKPRDELSVSDGIAPRRFPMGLSRAAFRLKTVATGKERALEFIGGLCGVTQETDSGALHVKIGWGVREPNPFSVWIATLIPEAERHPAADKQAIDKANRRLLYGMPKELLELAMLSNGAMLFRETKNTWHLRTLEEYERVGIHGLRDNAVVVADLKDGRVVAYTKTAVPDPAIAPYMRRVWWVVVGQIVTLPDPRTGADRRYLRKEETHVIAMSVVSLFEQIAHHWGDYYFDEPGWKAPAPSPFHEEAR